ncbi:hypothetical protein B0T24DRAFT_697817 [Lasiosphaeria ovina]|uniref:Serine protease n=1 Tax=Lasiosphaeria ovina TaxID=92902 RepID=A0AAE0KFL2_9PEZI|nr:hypothetical protein B0T24DRAFT_697817 [Lasiosphaeria ovina]
MPGLIVNGDAKGPIAGPGPATTTVAVWDLNYNEHNDTTPPADTEALLSVRPGEESIVGKDERVLVSKDDFMPGGKYRSVVKLFLHFAGQADDDPWALATGWLIRDNLVVTAGHCAFDHSHGLNQLTHVKAYIGYHGNESITDPSYAVQFRVGKQAATTQNWLMDGTNEAADLSFIVLASPFTGVTPIAYNSTPLTGSSNIGIVGYPGDLMDLATGEKGAFMWQMFLNTNWDLSTGISHMLQYKIDTYGGNSGSAVFLQPPTSAADAKSIGVHVLGGASNSASVIGPLGNVFETYVAALDAYASGSLPAGVTREKASAQPWLTYINLPSTASSAPWNGVPPNNGSDGTGTEADFSGGGGPGTLGGNIPGVEFDFLDILNKGLKVVAPIATTVLKAGLPLALGPLGVPIASLAGVALSAAGKLAASATGTEADLGKAYTFDGVAERAVLGEAAIAALRHMGNDKCQEEGLFDSMASTIMTMAPTVRGVAPKILGAVTEPALRMALDSLSKAQTGGTEDTFAEPPIRVPKSHETDTVGLGLRRQQNQEAFIQALGASLTSQDAEGFFDVLSSVGDVIGKGLRVVGPIIGSVAKAGLPLLLGGTEADLSPPPFTFEGLSERALIGEAALLALMDMPVDKLQQEGLFDVMKKVVTTIGPIVLKTAPAVIKAVTPLVQGIMQGKGQDEAFINANLIVQVDAADIAAHWAPLAGYAAFVNWMHTLHPTNGNNAGEQALSIRMQNGFANPQTFGQESVYFATMAYGITRAAVPIAIRPPPAVWTPLHTLKFFSTLGPAGAPVPVTVANITARYQSLAVPARTVQLTNIFNAVQAMPAPPPNPTATWLWTFVLSAIEAPGTVTINGMIVRLTSHTPAAGGNFPLPNGPNPNPPPLMVPFVLEMHVADYIAMIRDMMLAFTTNAKTQPSNALNVW